MKRIFVFLLCAGALLACNKTQREASRLDIETTEILTSSKATVTQFTVTTDAEWKAEVSEKWVVASKLSGTGNDVVKLAVTANTDYSSREAYITIKAGALEKTVKLVQAQMNGILIDQDKVTVPYNGGVFDFPVKTNVLLTAQSDAAWMTVQNTKALEEENISVRIELNPGRESRTGHISIGEHALKQEITVVQGAFEPEFKLTDELGVGPWGTLSAPKEGLTYTFTAVTNMEFEADAPNADWIHITTQDKLITVTIDQNDGTARDEYIYMSCHVGKEDYSDYGAMIAVKQKGSTNASFEWGKTLASLSIPAANNRLAYSATGALLISGGEHVHAVNPADGTYWKSITYPGIIPDSICSDDAGNVIVMPNVQADMDWSTSQLTSGKELTIYYSADPNEMTQSIKVPNLVYGTVGGLRVRGKLAEKAVISGVVGGASCWFGYDIENYNVVPNYYGTQNQGPGAGINTVWNPTSAAAISLGASLKDGVLYRGYDGKESLYFLADAYTPNWAVPYAWEFITADGSGGNENQNNLAIAEYGGKRILAYTQGFHFSYSSNANIYVKDITDIHDVKSLITINPAENISEELPFTGETSADVLLHPTNEALELFFINSSKGVVAKYKIDLGE